MDARFSYPEIFFLLENPVWFLSPITAPRPLSFWKERPKRKDDYLIHILLKLRMHGFINPLSIGTSLWRTVWWNTRTCLTEHYELYGTLLTTLYLFSCDQTKFYFQTFLLLTRTTSLCININSSTYMTKQFAVSCV